MEINTINSLLRPESYPEPTASVRLVQTHISFIFITDDYAYKIKKPVDFGFLNFTTIDRRRFYCGEEVRLNRRLCPDVYLGVAELRETSSGASFCGEGRVIDYAVKMKRLPDELMLDRLLAEGKVTEQDIRRIAGAIARFHLKAERGETIDKFGGIVSIRRNWEENFQTAERFVGQSLSAEDLSLIKGYVGPFLAGNESLFAERVKNGFIRECDGDIHAENICLTDPVAIFDCIEFSEHFRYSDTAADIAFFLMDLDFHQRSGFAGAFLDEYRKVTGDRELLPLLDFYKLYRAFVRGKVESLKMVGAEVSDAERTDAAQKAERYFRLARGYILRKRISPALIITCGLMGSGKSAIASELAFELGVEIFSSDAIRKVLTKTPTGERRHDGYGMGIYTPEVNEEVYGALLAKSEETLKGGRSIIADATFRRRGDRGRFAFLAASLGVPFYIVHTFCPDSLAKERLDSRAPDPKVVSDGRWEIYQPQREEFEPPDDAEAKVIRLDTSNKMGDNIRTVLKSLGICNGE